MEKEIKLLKKHYKILYKLELEKFMALLIINFFIGMLSIYLYFLQKYLGLIVITIVFAVIFMLMINNALNVKYYKSVLRSFD